MKNEKCGTTRKIKSLDTYPMNTGVATKQSRTVIMAPATPSTNLYEPGTLFRAQTVEKNNHDTS
jgi:hypothetical protein